MRVLKRGGSVYLGDGVISPHQEFFRAMWCPEVEESRQDAMNEVAYHRAHDRPSPLRIGNRSDGLDRMYAVTLQLSALELGDMRGKGNEMIQWVAKELVERINHESLYAR